jgi:hypothetical protein
MIRPIAFRPTPVLGGSGYFHGSNTMLSGASTPTNPTGPSGPSSFRTINAGLPPSGTSANATPTHGMTPVNGIYGRTAVGPGGGPGGGGGSEVGFAPGHPLVKEGRRHYGSECSVCVYYICGHLTLAAIFIRGRDFIRFLRPIPSFNTIQRKLCVG